MILGKLLLVRFVIKILHGIDNLGKQMVSDEKTMYEHNKSMEAPRGYSKDKSDERFDEFMLCKSLREENFAGVAYMFRDREVLQNSFHKFIEGHNAKMMECLFEFSNIHYLILWVQTTQVPFYKGTMRNQNVYITI